MGLYGGQNHIDIFRVKENAGGTAYDILAGLANSVAATPTTADAAFVNNQVESTALTYTETGDPGINVTQWESDNWEAFLQVVNPPTVVPPPAGLPDKVFENGVTASSASADTNSLVLVVHYGSANIAKDKIKVGVFLMNVVKTSGSVTTTGADYNKPTFELQSVRPKFAISMPAGVYRNTIVNTTAANTAIPSLAINANRAIKFVDKPE